MNHVNGGIWAAFYGLQIPVSNLVFPKFGYVEIGEVKLGQIIQYKKIIEVVLTLNFEKL